MTTLSLTVIIQDLGNRPSLTGLCAGFELGAWRSSELARSLIAAIPSFALSHDEKSHYDLETGFELWVRALRVIYSTDKYSKRGEFGEILLHVVLKNIFKAEPAISKVFFKDAENDTVKGFDAVHVIGTPDGELELWVGEVKFYKELRSAISDVVKELKAHTERDYLRSEFAAVTNKVNDSWEHGAKLKALLNESTSLDAIFARMAIPVLLTYESAVVGGRVDQLSGGADPSATEGAYRHAFELEVRSGLQAFERAGLPSIPLVIYLILVPLASKQLLVDEMHARLTNLRDGLLS